MEIYFLKDEWIDFCHIIEELPYGKELICYGIGGNNSNETA